MDSLQIRMNRGLVDRIDSMVESGIYSNRADVIRDAVRRFVWEKEAGSVSRKGNSVKIVRKARKKLSSEGLDLDEVNNL